MKIVSKAARRYSTALIQIAIEDDRLETILRDVQLIHNTIESSRELRLFLKSPLIKVDDKRNVLKEMFGKSTDPFTMQFVELVLQKNREALLDQIMQGFIDLYKRHANIIDVVVHTAMNLSDEIYEDLRQALESVTEKKVDLDVHVKPELIGGMTVRIDDTVIDGSVKHKMERLETLFKEAAI